MREPARSIERGLGDTWKGQTAACPELTQSGTVLSVLALPVKQVGTPREQVATAPVVHGASVRRVDFATTQRFGSPFSSAPRVPAPIPAPRRRSAWPEQQAAASQDAFKQAMALAHTIPALTPEELGLSAAALRSIESYSTGERAEDLESSFARSLEASVARNLELSFARNLEASRAHGQELSHDIEASHARELVARELVDWGAADVESSGVRELRECGARGDQARPTEVEPLELWLDHRDRDSLAASSCTRARFSANPLTCAWQLWQQLPAPLAICAAAALCVLSALAAGLFAN